MNTDIMAGPTPEMIEAGRRTIAANAEYGIGGEVAAIAVWNAMMAA